ncbi:MAG: N-acetylmuramoyl-L-alanine amidase [Phycisphaerales bacterium]|nr:N-acetylmuramoyl-L-alanine amidase [Phycisphaerales bacterium]
MSGPYVISRSRRTARTKIVWGVLGVGMMLGVAALSVLDPSASGSRGGGVTLSPLMSTGGLSGVEAVFQTQSELDTEHWNSIVIVHSGSSKGTPASIESTHRAAGYDGLGFHFLIGNGTGMGDGNIHVGQRWLDQRDGADLAGTAAEVPSSGMIEICLVGDGNRKSFSDEQLHRLAQLVAALSEKFSISSERILLHKDIAGTTSPGQYFPRTAFEQRLVSLGVGARP